MVPNDSSEDEDVIRDAAEVIDLEDVDEDLVSSEEETLPENELFRCDAPIYCCASLPPKSLVAIGTGDDRFLLLDYTSKGILLESKFSDSVQFVSFDPVNGKYVCACDMSSKFRVWKLDSLSPDPIWEIETAEVTNIAWHPAAANVLFAGTSQGELWMWKIPEGRSKYFSGSSGKALVAFCVLSGECFGAFKDGSYVKWDLRNQETLASLPPSGEEDEPLCVTANRPGTLAFVGLANGQVLVMGLSRPFGIQRRLVCVEDDKSEYRYVESVVLNNEETMLCVGTALGSLMFFSLADYTLYSCFNMEGEPSVVKAVWREKQVIGAFYDGYVAVVDPRKCSNASETRKTKAFSDAVLDFVLLEDDRIVAASQSGQLRILRLPDATSFA